MAYIEKYSRPGQTIYDITLKIINIICKIKSIVKEIIKIIKKLKNTNTKIVIC